MHPKKYEKLKNSGNFIGFELFEIKYSTEPEAYFYNWLYLNALNQNKIMANKVLKYKYFSDIEFNPKKSFSSQSKSVALFVSMKKNGIFDENIKNAEAFLNFSKSLKNKNELDLF